MIPQRQTSCTDWGLFKGSDTGYNLEGAADRNQAQLCLSACWVRKRRQRLSITPGALKCPFTDVPDWAKPQVTWLYEAIT
jgi:NADPH-dependent 7-cyano-7-deazaguanine reductase QueF